jgi:hypothetical protein
MNGAQRRFMVMTGAPGNQVVPYILSTNLAEEQASKLAHSRYLGQY